MKRFPFNDLHSFKDYVNFVKMCAPDQFLQRKGRGPAEQWTLDLAFEGLRFGLAQAIGEKGERPAFEASKKLVEEAYDEYKAGRMREGFFKLEEVNKILKKIPTQ